MPDSPVDHSLTSDTAVGASAGSIPRWIIVFAFSLLIVLVARVGPTLHRPKIVLIVM